MRVVEGPADHLVSPFVPNYHGCHLQSDCRLDKDFGLVLFSEDPIHSRGPYAYLTLVIKRQ